MPPVSKNPLSPEYLKEIQSALWWLIARFRLESETEIFFSSFLSKTERIMLAKRLAIALLIEKGFNTGSICSILKVSKATVAKIKERTELGGGYKIAFEKLESRESFKKFLRTLERTFEVIHDLIPPQKYSYTKERYQRFHKGI